MTILSAAFLGGLLLIGLPIWLHRLRAHSAQQRSFSSLYLMRKSEAPVNMQKRLQFLFLLALRILFIVLLCLAFAELEFDVAGADNVGSLEPDRLIVIDNSLSMSSSGSGQSVLGDAKARARDIVGGMATGSRGALVTTGNGIEIVTSLTADVDLLKGAIATVSSSAERLAYGGLLGRLATIAGAMGEPGEPKVVHLISDFQSSGMPDQFNALVENATIRLELELVGFARANWSIASMQLIESDRTITLQVAGSAMQERLLTVALEREGDAVATQEIFVPAGGVRNLTFPVDLDTRAPREWLARLDTVDALTLDNVRYVAHVARAEQSIPYLGANDRGFTYVHAALQAGLPQFEPQRSDTLDSLAAPVVIVHDARIAESSRLEKSLQEYVAQGGAVLLIAGDNARAANRLPILDVELDAGRIVRSDFGVVPVDRTHPVLGGLTGWPDVAVYQSTRVATTGTGRVILALDDGSPLLEEYRAGAGRLLVLLSALDPQWNSLVVQPSFARLFANMVSYLAEDVLPTAATVAQPFAIPAQSVQLFDSSGTRVLGLADTVDRPAISLDLPGIYSIRTPSRSQPLAVNIDARESRLEQAESSLLEDWRSAVNRAADTAQRGPRKMSPDADFANRYPLAPWLLAVLALIVLAECLTANWLSSSNRATLANSTPSSDGGQRQTREVPA